MKRYIRSDINYDFTSFIDPETSDAVDAFMNIDKIDEYDWSLVKEALNEFWSDYEKFPNPNTIEELDMKYDLDKRTFYNKWIEFARKCKELSKELKHVSGYGRMDAIKLELAKRLGAVDYHFPYGWRYV